uniref:Integrase catalytic domain-containing protein n=1 Tax=Arundo donax TaxID=35708 RepID=A0A0A9B6H2_ARUDO
MDTKLHLSSAYHPQTDGQTKRVNQCLEMYLRCVVHSSPKQWVQWLPLAEFWYNTSHHSALQCSPFKALYGVEPSYGAVPQLANTTNSEVIDTIQELQLFTEILKEQLSRAQNKMKHYADGKSSARNFQVGEQVLLRLQPYAQTSVVNRPCPKLAFKYFGPYTVQEKIGEIAYKLELPAESLIHLVFHVSVETLYSKLLSGVY